MRWYIGAGAILFVIAAVLGVLAGARVPPRHLSPPSVLEGVP